MLINRTNLLKLGYPIVIVSILVTFIYLAENDKIQIPHLLLATLTFFIIGRLVRYVWRDLTIGCKLVDKEKYEESIPHFQKFVRLVRRHKWLNILIWIAPSLYTTSALALGLQNLGHAHLLLGEIERSQSYFEEALKIDKYYPLPHYCLAFVESLRGNTEKSNYHLTKSRRLGFSGGKIDRALHRLKIAGLHI